MVKRGIYIFVSPVVCFTSFVSPEAPQWEYIFAPCPVVFIMMRLLFLLFIIMMQKQQNHVSLPHICFNHSKYRHEHFGIQENLAPLICKFETQTTLEYCMMKAFTPLIRSSSSHSNLWIPEEGSGWAGFEGLWCFIENEKETNHGTILMPIISLLKQLAIRYIKEIIAWLVICNWHYLLVRQLKRRLKCTR